MGIGSFLRGKEVRWEYEFALKTKDSYTIVIDVDTPIKWWEQVLGVLKKRDVPILEEFSIEERFKPVVAQRMKPQIKKIADEVKKDFTEFSILNANCDDMRFKKTSPEDIHCRIVISGLCHARK